MRRDELAERLRRAYRVEMDPDTAARHLSVVSARLGTAQASRPGGGRFRRRVAALAAALAVTLPGGLALAAEGTVPGDVLYPVKLATERVRSIFDAAVTAEHRLEEVETMLERDVPLDRVVGHLDVARDAVDDMAEGEELQDRLERLTKRVRDRMMADRPGDRPFGDDEGGPGNDRRDRQVDDREDVAPGDTAPSGDVTRPHDRRSDRLGDGEMDRPGDG